MATLSIAGVGITPGDAFVIGEHGVLLEDAAVFREQWSVAGVGLAGGFVLPLEVADPEDELGDGDGLFVEFEADEMLGADAEPLHLHPGVSAQGVDELEHLGFKPLHVLHGDVEKVRGAAGGVQHGEAAEVTVEGDDLGEGFGVLLVGILAEAGGVGSELFRLGGGTG